MAENTVQVGPYQGQPDYVVVSFLNDLFEPWSRIVSDEWGDFIHSLACLIDACIRISDTKRAGILCEWFIAEMDLAFEQHWWSEDEYYKHGIYHAQDCYVDTVKYWRERAKSFKGEEALEEAIVKLPDWIKPSDNRPPKPDPDRELYEKLKARYGD